MGPRVKKCYLFFYCFITKKEILIDYKMLLLPFLLSVLTSLFSIQISKFLLTNETVKLRTFIFLNNSDIVILTKRWLNTKLLVTDPKKHWF